MEIVQLSSKGQIVIPKEIRDDLRAVEGTSFMVVKGKDTVILKKIEKPKIMWEEVTKPFHESARKSGFTQKDLFKLIKKVRTKK